LNELILKEYDGERAVYLYKPEGKGDGGEVIYVVSSKEATVSKLAPNDTVGRYGSKAAAKIKERADKNVLPLNFIQAWY